MKPVDDRDLRLTIRARNDDGTANGSSCSREVLGPFQSRKAKSINLGILMNQMNQFL